jgi:hypothetical protein
VWCGGFWFLLKLIATNGFTLGEEADLEAHTFSIAQTPIKSTNVQFNTKPAFLPILCYAFALFFRVDFQ